MATVYLPNVSCERRAIFGSFGNEANMKTIFLDSKTGNDAYTGMNENEPKASFEAAREAVGPGGRIFVSQDHCEEYSKETHIKGNVSVCVVNFAVFVKPDFIV